MRPAGAVVGNHGLQTIRTFGLLSRMSDRVVRREKEW